MQFTKEDLKNLSTLARISIKKEEEEKMLHDMQSILGYISMINDAASDMDKEQLGSRKVKDGYNRTREDVITHDTGSNTERILEESPASEDGYVKVSQVLG